MDLWQILFCWDSEKGKALSYTGLKASKGGTVSLLLSSSLKVCHGKQPHYRQAVCNSAMHQSPELKPARQQGEQGLVRRGNGVRGSAGLRHMSVRAGMATLSPLTC